MSLIDQALEMMGKSFPQIAGKAKEEYQKYSPDKAGLMQAIYDWGGLEMADKAVSFAQNSPKINRLLKMVNIDPVKIRAELNTAPPVTQSRSSSNFKPAGDTYKDRLKKLG